MAENKFVIVQLWEKVDKNLSTCPDGYSLHLTSEEREKFIQTYWNDMPDSMPSEFARPVDTPYEAEVSSDRFRKISQSIHGVRCGFGRAPKPKKL